jgi:hypothetical protein
VEEKKEGSKGCTQNGMGVLYELMALDNCPNFIYLLILCGVLASITVTNT